VDTDGLLLMVNLTTADISDSAGAQEIVSATTRSASTSRRRWSLALASNLLQRLTPW